MSYKTLRWSIFLNVGRHVGPDKLFYVPNSNGCSLEFMHPTLATEHHKPVLLSREAAEELLIFLPKESYLA